MKNFGFVVGVLLGSSLAFSPVADARMFGVDVCYNAPDSGEPLIRNCIGVEEACRTSNLVGTQPIGCRAVALGGSMSGLSGGNAIVGGRSLVHSDSTYLMAQLIGFTSWQAYQMMIYDEATDQSEYTPYDQNGLQLLSAAEIDSCRGAWGPQMPRSCSIITPLLNGVYKFNDATGGMLLHLHARYSPNGLAPPPVAFPANYFAPSVAAYEPLLNNFRAWVFDERPDACVAGFVVRGGGADRQRTLPCERPDRVLHSPQNFFAAGFTKLAIPFESTLGQLIINQDDRGTVVATDRSLQAYIGPQDANYAKMGMFLHTLGDRYSHHICTDHSYAYRQVSGNYNTNYSQVGCAQGSHFLWHAWEQGTNQSSSNLDPEYQTMRPALEAAYDQLVAYARHQGVVTTRSLNKPAIISSLIEVLQIFDPKQRLDAMVALTENYGLLALPGHGNAARYSIEQWLVLAKMPAPTR